MSQEHLCFTDLLALKQNSENEYESLQHPRRLGNSMNIAYGGFALAMAVKSASETVPQGYHLYTLLGAYLGPALTDRPLFSSITTIRQTRTFATRSVTVSQRQDDGSQRACLHAIADFQVPEPASMFVYSSPPTKSYTHWSKADGYPVHYKRMVDTGKVSQALVDAHRTTFGLLPAIYDMRPCPEGIQTQNLTGMAKALPTTQDYLPLHQKSHADWFRSHSSLPTPADKVASVAFLLDAAIAFAPLVFSHMFLDDAAACSSLDFALRIFRNDVDLEEWCLKEVTTHVGAEGRTYNESRLWDGEGRLVASMTQQDIMRPHRKKVDKVKL